MRGEEEIREALKGQWGEDRANAATIFKGYASFRPSSSSKWWGWWIEENGKYFHLDTNVPRALWAVARL